MTELRSGSTELEAWQGGLLATKLVAPLPPWQPVPRPRLSNLLASGTRGPLTVLAAPPGAGKTMLLASWIRDGQPPGPVAWMTVDRGDADPVRFWSHVVAALRSSGAVPPGALLAGLGAPPHDAVQAFFAVLVNGLAELPGPVVLVLDDLHEATGAEVPAGLEFVLRHAPPQLRLVVATRADPSWSLQRLRVAGQLTEIRAHVLAFTQAETGELLAGLGVSLPDSVLGSLWRRTEGWAAGLRLVAMHLRDHPDPARFVADFTGDDRAVAAYLIEEVLARLPLVVQDFLLRTCVVDRLCGGLADALTGRADGERMLSILEHDNAFTSRLGPGRAWYRYHSLFLQLLRAELRRRWPEEIPRLHRRAASWHAANGLAEEAVVHALRADDLDAATGLLAAHGLGMLLDGRARTLRELLGRLPADRLRRDRELAVLMAAAWLAEGEPEEAETWLDLAAAVTPSATWRQPGPITGLAELLRARVHGDVDGVLSAALRLPTSTPTPVPDEPEAEADLRTLVLSAQGVAELWSGRLDDAAKHLQEVRGMVERGGRQHVAVEATAHLALAEALRGRLAVANRLGAEAAVAASRHGWSASPQAACGELAVALAAYHHNDLIAAFAASERAARAARLGRDRPVLLAVALVDATLVADGGRAAAADGLVRLRASLSKVAGWRLPGLLAATARATEARLLAAAGDIAGAAALLGADDAAARPAAEAVVLARLRLVDGDPVAARRILAPLRDGRARAPGPATLIEAWLLDAVAHRRLANHEAAASSLECALALAAPEGHRRVFAEGGAPVRALLADHLRRGSAYPELVVALLDDLLGQIAATAPSAGGTPAPSAVPPPVEMLSEREHVVLRYLSSMLSAGEIADELYVSVNTVKTHIKSIYRKLDANRRRDAVRRARQLHLL